LEVSSGGKQIEDVIVVIIAFFIQVTTRASIPATISKSIPVSEGIKQ
jgi:hypothetical protein